MDFLKEINDKTIIVCPSSVKKKILIELNKYNYLINIKMYTFEELKKHLIFDYDINTILYLMDKYGYTYDSSKEYIDNLYYIEDIDYKNDKLNYLVRLKKELTNHNLLDFHTYFKENNKNNLFIVFGYNYLTKFNERLLSNFNYKIIEKKEFNKANKVYKFNNLEEEIVFVINEIITLINRGIDINNIYLLNTDSDYENEIIRLFNMFNIPVDISKSSSVLSSTIGKKIFNFLEENKSFESTLEYIKSFGIEKERNKQIYNCFLNIFNKYVDLNYSFDVVLKAIYYDLKNTIINDNKLKRMIKVTSLDNNYFDENDYVFLLGFNQGSIPITIKDEDYISDDLKELVKLDNTSLINKKQRISTINNINSIKNITISYKEHYLNKDYLKSNLITDLNLEVISNTKLDTSYSLIYSNIKLSEMLDNLIKYNENNEDLSKYYKSLDNRYMKYDNKYKKIDKNTLISYLNNKLVLSYSSIDTFFKCSFRYYLDNILKLNKFEESFEIYIGKLFHYVLSFVYEDDFNLDEKYNLFIKDKEFSNKEKFYLEKLKKELEIICNNLKEFYSVTELIDVMTEKNIVIDKSSEIEIVFKGIIDKIMYKKESDKTYVSVIDYKTGSTSIDIFNSAYGIGMQLIIYLYLIAKSNLFENYYFVGFYLQKILNNEVVIDSKKSYLELKNDNLKLNGYSTDDKDILRKFDKSFENSKYIKGMKVSSNGFYNYSKVIDEKTINDLISYVDKKVDLAKDEIINAKFDINPKWLYGDKDSIGCKYCKYKDICFRKNEDYVNLAKYTDFSFLKDGDIND